MASYRTTVDSPRSLDDLFELLADFSSVATWDPGVVEAERLDEGELTVGSRFRVVTSTAGRRQTLVYEITELDRPERLVLVGENRSLRSVDTLTFTARPDGGTSVTYHADLALRGAARFADPLLHVAFQVIGRKARDGLREFVTST